MKNKRMLVRWLCLLLLVVTVVGITIAGAAQPAPKASGLELEDMVVVVPKNATDVEMSAAKEMVAYVKKMTGKTTTIVAEGTAVKSAVYVGATKFAEENNITYTDNNGLGEGWAVKAIGNDLVITGGETRGVLYGVYHLLEDHFGIHWWNMWEEYVPSLESAVVPFGYDESGEPLFSDRGTYSNEGMSTLFYVRNRMNGWTSNGTPAFGGERNFARPYHVHTFSRFLPAHYNGPTKESDAKWLDAMNPDHVDWFEVHPEWYAWMESRQARIDFGQFCMSSEGLLEALTERVLIAIEMSYEDADKAGKARPEYISITPNDTGGFCECADCRASLAASGASGHLLKFVNRIAKVVAKEYPEMKVETLAYWQYFEVPTDDTVPDENVVIRLASSDIDIMHDLNHPNNVKAKARLEKWSELLLPGQLWYWDYGIVSGTGGITTNYFKYGNDWQMFYEAGGFGVFIEQQKFNLSDFWDMKHWVQTKLMEDPYQDVHELCKTFLKGYYGEAAAEDLYDYLVFVTEAAMDWEQPITFNYASFTKQAEWMDGFEALKAWQYFLDAEEKTENDDSLTSVEKELYLNRINAARGALDRTILYNHYRFSVEVGTSGDQTFGINRRDVVTRYKEGLRWLADMENTADHTGIETVNKRGSYNAVESEIDTYANLMGMEEEYAPYPEIPNPEIPDQIYEDHPDISDAHIFDFPGHTIWSAGSYGAGWEWIQMERGAASYGDGIAIKYDQAEMVKRNVSESDILKYYSFSTQKPIFSNMTKKLYLDAPLVADGEYHLYRMSDVVVYTSAKTEISLFADSLLLSLGGTMQHLKDKTVDVYVNMKIEGDPSFADRKNPGVWYIDRFIIVLPCEQCDVVYNKEISATCSSNAGISGKCPLCGKTVVKEYEYTKLDHQLTGDFYYDEATGLYKAPCATCGTAEFDFCGRLPEELEKSLRETGTSLDYLYMYDVDDFREVKYTSFIEVADPDSPMKTSAKYDLTNKYNDGSLKHYMITGEKPFRDLDGKLPGVPAKDIIADGKYHLYGFHDVILRTDSNSEFHFYDWALSVDFAKLPILNQKVDLYVSMKVEGELQYTDVNNLPNYYVDRMFIVGNCPAHVADSYTYNAETATYTGTCVNCGGVVSHKFMSGLPAEVAAALSAADLDVSHAHVYGVDDVQLYGGMTKVADEDSAVGYAALCENYTGASSGLVIKQYAPEKVIHTIPASTLKANSGKGYQLYKINDLKLPKNPASGEYYLLFFGWNMQTRKMVAELGGKTVDLYISMKVEGDPATGADFYIDQIIAVDDCNEWISMKKEDLVIKTPAACGKNAVADTKCAVCRRDIKNVEVPNTMLQHDFTEDPNTCSICGESKLPKMLTDDLAAKGLSNEHAHEYGADQFSLSGMSRVDDPESAVGRAAKRTNYKINNTIDFGTWSPEKRIGTISKATLQAADGKGYQVYSFKDVTLPKNPVPLTQEYYVFTLGWYLQNKQVVRELGGKTVDLYFSLKVVGDIGVGADVYVDRMWAVDSCSQYSKDEYVYGSGTGTCQDANDSIGKCPVCGKENPAYTKPGTDSGKHSFTKYIQDSVDVTAYIAECDYGCGATDLKRRQYLTQEQELPANFPEQSKNHIIQVYTAGEFGIHADDDYYMWDLELDYPVGVRPCLDPLHKYLNMNASNGIELSMYVGSGTTKTVGRIHPGTDSGKGYKLYSFENVIPIVERENHYFYMFKDWCIQIRMLPDDLEDYYQKPVDMFVYMKTEGDVSCNDPDNLPVYTVASIIVAEKCPYNPDTMEVVTPATCSTLGEAYGYCPDCQKDVTTNIPKLAHDIMAPVVSIEATCEYDEVVKGVCSVCNQVVKQERSGTKLEHIYEDYYEQEDGTSYAFCENGCGERDYRQAGLPTVEIPDNVQQMLPTIGNIIGGAAGAFGFSDVTEADWFYDEVKLAWEYDLIDGVTATQYRPNETLTRAQAIKLAAALNQMYFEGSVTLSNGDYNWYDTYVDYAVENGIIDAKYAGYSKAQMDAAISRSEFVKIFSGTMEESCCTGWNEVADNAIPDVKMTDANADVIYKFYRAGILTG